MLRQPLLRQLAQRITARYHLLPLARSDVDAYVRFRLQVAGCVQPVFTPAAIKTLHRLSGGIPRLINLICDRALLSAYSRTSHKVSPKDISLAAYEVSGIRNDGGWLSLALSKAERTNTATDESFPFEYDQPVAVTLVGNYQINDKWDVGAKWWYHSGAPYTPVTGATADPEREGRYIPVYGDINSERMPNYHRLDLRLSRRFSKQATAYVEFYAVTQ